MRKLLSLAMVLLLGVSTLFAQAHLVKGRILDGDGKPVDGATVRVKKGTAVTAADAQGNFKIEAKAGDVLVISAVNFGTKEVRLGNETDVAVTLSRQSSQLDEVVVTAMGIKRSRNALPYAAQEVGGDEVSKTRNSNFVDGLSGKVAGLQITQPTALGASTNVVLRGIKSISQSNQALFVVDGVPFDNTSSASGGQRAGRGGYDYGSNAADLNPDDIESISVLKGAAASALYGSRAANGVILITTKKAKRGLGITVNAGMNVGKYDKSTFVKYQHDYGANYGSGPEIGGAFPYGYGSPDGNFLYAPLPQFGQNSPQLIVPTTEDASYGAKFNPNLLVYQWDAFANYPGNPNYGKPTPWVAAKNDPSTFFVNPVSYNTSVFIDGGGENGTFKLGYLRTSDNGILPNSNITKNMFNFGATHNLTKNLTVGGTINYSEISGLGRYGTGYTSNNIMSNFRQWWEMNVDIKQQKTAYFNSGGKNVTWNMTDPVNGNTNPIYWDNVYFVRYQNYEQDSRQRVFGNAYINYTPSKSITLLGRVSMDTYNSLQEERDAIGSVNVPFYSRNNMNYKEVNYDFLATYNKDLSKNFNFKALLGANLRQDTYSSIFASTNGGLNLPNFYALSNSVNPINAPNEALLEKEVGGVFAGATLTYKDMLTLDGTVRRDQSSTLPAGNNAYTYPAISGSWAFYKMIDNAPWLSFGKVRVNYAEVGNDAPYHSVLNTYTINSPFNGNALVSLPTVNNNPNLKPERTKSFETGLEMSFFKNRLGFDFTYFASTTFDLITQVNTSGATGFLNQYVNFGSIQNNGIELSINGTPIRTRNFSWDINVNWSKINNKVLSLFNNQQNQVLQSYQGGVSINATVGQPFGTIQGNNFVYTNGQRTVKANGYYLKDNKTTDIIGNATPKWTGGINNSFHYKSFTFSFLIDMRQGGSVFSLDTYYGFATGLYDITAGLNDLGNPSRNSLANGGGIILKGVTADGKTNTKRVDNSGNGYGLYGYYRNPASAFVYDASFVKLRELNISYSLPQRAIEKMKPIKGIDIAIVGRNLWIISKNVPYADPEDGLGAGNAQGYQSGSYPAVRNIGFNVKFKF